MGNHQRCWIWGRHAVVEMIRAARWPAHEVLLADDLPAEELEELSRRLATQSVPVRIEPAAELARQCGAAGHQGFAAKMEPFPLEDAETGVEGDQPPISLILDSIQDAFNYGAILRSAEALGIGAVYVSRQGQAEVSSQVARSSAGAVNHLRLMESQDLKATLKALRSRGVQLVAASERGAQSCGVFRFSFPTAIVIGSEGSGIRRELLQLCDCSVAISLTGQVSSLNAAVAAGIVLYEAARQKKAGPS